VADSWPARTQVPLPADPADPAGPAPAGIDTGTVHIARVYNYWLGGKDNSAADRAAAEQVIAAYPAVLASVRARRAATWS